MADIDGSEVESSCWAVMDTEQIMLAVSLGLGSNSADSDQDQEYHVRLSGVNFGLNWSIGLRSVGVN